MHSRTNTSAVCHPPPLPLAKHTLPLPLLLGCHLLHDGRWNLMSIFGLVLYCLHRVWKIPADKNYIETHKKRLKIGRLGLLIKQMSSNDHKSIKHFQQSLVYICSNHFVILINIIHSNPVHSCLVLLTLYSTRSGILQDANASVSFLAHNTLSFSHLFHCKLYPQYR